MDTSCWCAGDVLRLFTLQPQAYQDCHHWWVSWRHLLQHWRACLRLQWGGHQQHGPARERSNAAKQRLIRHSIQEGAMHISQAECRIQDGRRVEQSLDLIHCQVPGRPWRHCESCNPPGTACQKLLLLILIIAFTNSDDTDSAINISAFLQPQWNLGNLLPVYPGGALFNLSSSWTIVVVVASVYGACLLM